MWTGGARRGRGHSGKCQDPAHSAGEQGPCGPQALRTWPRRLWFGDKRGSVSVLASAIHTRGVVVTEEPQQKGRRATPL